MRLAPLGMPDLIDHYRAQHVWHLMALVAEAGEPLRGLPRDLRFTVSDLVGDHLIHREVQRRAHDLTMG